MKIKQRILLGFVLVGIVAVFYILFQTKKSSFIYSDFGVKIPKNYPIIGIDISHHQGEINFEETLNRKERKDSIQFVYIKTTEGADFTDRNFDQNAEGFAAYGMNYGFYHYYQPDKSAVEQALFYCETVKLYNFKLIPVVDIEVIGQQTKAQLIDSITVFIDKVDEILECRPMLYTYISFFKDYFDESSLANELFWLASYSSYNPYMEKENVIIWQFSEKGTIDGIGTKVDMNVAKESFRSKVIR